MVTEKHLRTTLTSKLCLLLMVSDIITSLKCPGAKEGFCTHQLSTTLPLWVSMGCSEARIRSGERCLTELYNAISYRWDPTLLWDMLDMLSYGECADWGYAATISWKTLSKRSTSTVILSDTANLFSFVLIKDSMDTSHPYLKSV